MNTRRFKIFPLILCLASLVFSPFLSQANEQVVISGTISPGPTSFSLNLTSNAKKEISAGSVIEYTLTYESHLKNSSSFTLEAEWSLGTPEGEDVPSVEIVTYIPGSASVGHNNTKPIIDSVNRRITWEIENFPGNNKESVTFRLKAKDSSAFDRPVSFSVQARLFQKDMSLPWQTIHHTYTPPKPPHLSPTPPAPTTPPKTPSLNIVEMDVREITQTTFSFYLKTTNPAQVEILYGENLEFNHSLHDDQFLTDRIITLENLNPDITYYFTIRIKDRYGQTYFPSEIYVFRTASQLLPDTLDIEKLIASAQGLVIIDNSIQKQENILLPHGTALTISLPVKKDIVTNAFIRIIDKRVLGITSFRRLHFLERTPLIQTKPLLYSGQVQTPAQNGQYDVIILVEDNHGNIFQKSLFTLHISNPLQITDEEKSPVEKAQILIERYNPQTNLFERWQSESSGMANPEYTNHDGEIPFVLPEGRYRFKISAVGYKSKEAVLNFSPYSDTAYPLFALKKDIFSFKNLFTYYREAGIDTTLFFNRQLNAASASNRFIDFNLLLAIAIASILSLTLTAKRLELSLIGLLIYLKKYFPKKNPTGYAHSGNIRDSNSRLPLRGATVQAISTDSASSHTLTDILGEFTLHLNPEKEYKIIVKKPHYFTKTVTAYGSNLPSFTTLYLNKKRSDTTGITAFYIFIINSLIKSLADTTLVGLLIIHTFLIFKLGYYQVLPLTLITLINLLLWLDFTWQKWQKNSSSLNS